MSGYDQPLTVSYSLGTVNFETTPTAQAIKVPTGYTRGRVEEVAICATVAFPAVTTLPSRIALGTAGDPNKYCNFIIGALAITDAKGAAGATSGGITDAGKQMDFSAQGDNITQIEVLLVANTGGAPAGTGVPVVVISWFK